MLYDILVHSKNNVPRIWDAGIIYRHNYFKQILEDYMKNSNNSDIYIDDIYNFFKDSIETRILIGLSGGDVMIYDMEVNSINFKEAKSYMNTDDSPFISYLYNMLALISGIAPFKKIKQEII